MLPAVLSLFGCACQDQASCNSGCPIRIFCLIRASILFTSRRLGQRRCAPVRIGLKKRVSCDTCRSLCLAWTKDYAHLPLLGAVALVIVLVAGINRSVNGLLLEMAYCGRCGARRVLPPP